MQKQWTNGCNEFNRSSNFVHSVEFIFTNCVIMIRLHCNVFLLQTAISILSFLFFKICFSLSLHAGDKMPVVWLARSERKYRTSSLYGSVLETGETIGRAMRKKSKRMARSNILIFLFPGKLLQFSGVAASC